LGAASRAKSCSFHIGEGEPVSAFVLVTGIVYRAPEQRTDKVTPVSEIGPYRFTPGAISRALIDDYSAEVQPKQKAA
jgi:hypothetical protein